MSDELTVTAEPLDEARCKFILSRPIHDGAVRRFGSVEAAEGFPVVQAVLSVPGICEVVVSGHVLTALRDSSRSWEELTEAVTYAIATAGAAGPPPPAEPAPDDDTIYHLASRLIEREINPAVARHGGRIELIDVQDATVVLRMLGGCQGCGMAAVTLKQGIEGSLRRVIPGLHGIRDVTDHASGANPYFSAAKK